MLDAPWQSTSGHGDVLSATAHALDRETDEMYSRRAHRRLDALASAATSAVARGSHFLNRAGRLWSMDEVITTRLWSEWDGWPHRAHHSPGPARLDKHQFKAEYAATATLAGDSHLPTPGYASAQWAQVALLFQRLMTPGAYAHLLAYVKRIQLIPPDTAAPTQATVSTATLTPARSAALSSSSTGSVSSSTGSAETVRASSSSDAVASSNSRAGIVVAATPIVSPGLGVCSATPLASWQPACPSGVPRCAAFNSESSVVSLRMFMRLADWVIGWPFQSRSEDAPPAVAGSSPSDVTIARSLSAGAIVFVHMDLIDDFARRLLPHIRVPFVIISGSVDGPSAHRNATLTLLASPLMTRWFTPNCDMQHDKLRGIPIGLNAHEHGPEMVKALTRLHPHIDVTHTPLCNQPPWRNESLCAWHRSALAQLVDAHSQHRYPQLPPEGLRSQPFVAINFGVQSYAPQKALFKRLCNAGAVNQSDWLRCPSVTYSGQANRVFGNPHLVPFYESESRLPIWLSPRGNGLDCHRTWEALYLGAVPVIESSVLDPLYADMPVIIVRRWEDVTERLLRSAYEDIRSGRRGHNRAKLTSTYWQAIIEQERALSIRAANEIQQRDTTAPISPVPSPDVAPRDNCSCMVWEGSAEWRAYHARPSSSAASSAPNLHYRLVVLVIADARLPLLRNSRRVWQSYRSLMPRDVRVFFMYGNQSESDVHRMAQQDQQPERVVVARDPTSAFNVSSGSVSDEAWLPCASDVVLPIEESYIPGIAVKTLSTLSLLESHGITFDFVLRTNLGSFWNWNLTMDYLHSLPDDDTCLAGVALHDAHGVIGASGAGFFLSYASSRRLLSLPRSSLQLDSEIDDVAFGRALVGTLGMRVLPAPRRCDIVHVQREGVPSLQERIAAIVAQCQSASPAPAHYRVKNGPGSWPREDLAHNLERIDVDALTYCELMHAVYQRNTTHCTWETAQADDAAATRQ